jgi:hypothetical protein
MILDGDITTWRKAATVVSAGYTTGIRVQKLLLIVGASAASLGTVAITAPSDSAPLYPILSVAASTAANTELFLDSPTDTTGALTWRDFAVTGLTATGTKLWIWWTV